MGSKGPKNLSGSGSMTRPGGARPKSSTPRTPGRAKITPAKPPAGGGRVLSDPTSAGIVRTPKVRTTTHNPSGGKMPRPAPSKAASRI